MQEKKETKITSAVTEEVKEASKAADTAKTEAKAAKTTKRTAAKKTAKKPAAKKPEAEVRMFVQYQSNDAEIATIQERIKNQFVAEGHRAGSIKTLEIYLKPEDYAAYYVINDKFSGRVDLF